ncbi:MAG: ABC transporter ATP-binding protein [Candidatus Methanodesulfokora sp.]
MSVVIKGVRKTYGNTVALRDVSLEVERGEFFAILGPSGSGKSTLLRLIAGLEEPDRGEIYVDGALVNGVDPSRRDVAMVFQSYALYPHMRVRDNIAFPLRMRRVPKEEIKSRVHEVASMLKIEHLLEKYPHQLSGGEQQRVALARAIVRRPKVFLLDEPLSNLDAKLRSSLRFELRKLLHDKLKTTTIYVTHDQVEAMTMADRIAVIESGAIVQVSPPEELYEKPKNTFVASFIGSPSMNFLPAKISFNKLLFENYYIESEELLKIRGFEEVLVGIRPRELDISPDHGLFKVRMLGVERLGGGFIAHTMLGDREIIVYTDEIREIEGASELYLTPRGSLYIFDKTSGELILTFREFKLSYLNP